MPFSFRSRLVTLGTGVVGPMGSSSFSLPSVEKAMMDMDGDDVSARLARMAGASSRRVRTNESPYSSLHAQTWTTRHR